MNARKHRKPQQAKETDRLGPKGTQYGSGVNQSPDATTTTAGVESKPKSSGVVCRTWKHCQPRPASRPGRPHRKAGRGRSFGRTEKANASGNALDRPTSVWSILARESVEPSRKKECK